MEAKTFRNYPEFAAELHPNKTFNDICNDLICDCKYIRAEYDDFALEDCFRTDRTFDRLKYYDGLANRKIIKESQFISSGCCKDSEEYFKKKQIIAIDTIKKLYDKEIIPYSELIAFQGNPMNIIEAYNNDNFTTNCNQHKATWKCQTCENIWDTFVFTRFKRNPTGCPVCNSGRLHSDGRNTMFNTHPKLATELKGKSGKNIIAGTHKRVEWVCRAISQTPCGTIWTTTGGSRVQGSNCPNCNGGGGYDSSKVGYIYILNYQADSSSWVKCGISNQPNKRFQQLSRAAKSHSIEVLQLDNFKFDDGMVAQKCEQELLNKLELRFNSEYDIDGKSEFFKYDALEEIKGIINKYQPN